MDEKYNRSHPKKIERIREDDQKHGAGVVENHFEEVISVFQEYLENQTVSVIGELPLVIDRDTRIEIVSRKSNPTILEVTRASKSWWKPAEFFEN